MNRALLIGDVHATPDELDDCQALIGLIRQVIELEEVENVIFLGDQYNTHSVMRVEVLAFWREAFTKLKWLDNIWALTGNHDFCGEGLAIHALMAHEEQVTVVDKPTFVFPGVLALPYFSDLEAFRKECSLRPVPPTLICHQTFQGAQYDNGMYAPGGVDPESIPEKTVISGHIHKPAQFGKVTYIGAPRWRTLSDANIDRAIWIYEFDNEGNVVGRKGFDTSVACRKICSLTDSPEAPVDSAVLTSSADWRIDVKGPADWIEKRKKELAGPGVRLRTFNTTKATPKLRESEGIDKAFDGFLKKYTPKYGTDRAILERMARERLG